MAVAINSDVVAPYTGVARVSLQKTSLPYLPNTIKLDQSQNEKAILGFSTHTHAIFSTLYPKFKPIEQLQKSFIDMDHQVSSLNQLSKELEFAEKHETRLKILALLGVAVTVALIAGTICAGIFLGTTPAICGLMPLIIASVIGVATTIPGTAYAFFGIKSMRKSIGKLQDKETIQAYQNQLKQFMDKHYEEIKKDLEKRIKKSKESPLTQNQRETLQNSLEELETLRQFSEIEKNDMISLSSASGDEVVC